jgi:DmsE family decaheme c-type cytochrome
MFVFGRCGLALLVCLGCSFVAGQSPTKAAAPAKPATAAAAPTYVGSNVCRTCHPDIAGTFYRNPHYKSIASGAQPGPDVGCESCHGPGSGHVQAGGGRDTIPRAFSKLQPQAVLDTCLTCHAQSITRANIRRSEHTLADIVCTNCHSVHRSPAPKNLLKTEQQRDLCYGCHTTVRAQFSMPFQHRVNEGSIQCTDCHNPHGAFTPSWNMATRPRMVDQVLGNEEPCLKCHIDKRGPFVYEHGAVRVEGCETCHNAHGSTNARLLKRPIVTPLCLECHTGNGNFGRTTTGVPRQTPYHNVSSPQFQNCTACHVRIHGSNADPYFFR